MQVVRWAKGFQQHIAVALVHRALNVGRGDQWLQVVALPRAAIHPQAEVTVLHAVAFGQYTVAPEVHQVAQVIGRGTGRTHQLKTDRLRGLQQVQVAGAREPFVLQAPPQTAQHPVRSAMGQPVRVFSIPA